MSNSNNIRNMNQSNPFWDFIASMQDPRNNHLQAGGPPNRPPPHGAEGFEPFELFEGHWGSGWGGPFGAMPYRGRKPEHGSKRHERGGPRGSRSPPPPPPEHESHEAGSSGLRGHHEHEDPRGPHPRHGSFPPGPPPPAYGGPEDAEDPPSRAPTPPSDFEESQEPHSHGPGHHGHGRGRGRGGPHGFGPRGHGPHGPHGPHGHRSRSNSPHGREPRGSGGRGGRFGMRGGHGHGPHGHRRGGPRGFGEFGGRGRHGSRGPGGPPPPFPFDLSALAEAFVPGLFGSTANNNSTVARGNTNVGMFHPELDLFDTVEAYILHMSLPGAKKPDLSITYSSARNSVTVSGVVARPDVDEEMMDALALDERKVGAFEREVKLEEGVKIDEEGISAKLEDGVLRVVVPKMMQEEDEEYVDVKRISLE